eukprot:1177889-Prorocentrum_minimum.AAC.7
MLSSVGHAERLSAGGCPWALVRGPSLSQSLQTEERNAPERTLVQASILYWHLGGWANLDKAQEMVEKVLTIQPNYPQAQCLKGWLELALEEADEDASGGTDRAMAIFEMVRTTLGHYRPL